MMGRHDYKTGNQKMACRNCGKKVGGKGSACPNDMMKRHDFV